MRLPARLRHFARNVFAPGRADRELDEEIRHHLDLETQEGVRRGLPEPEARRRALITFGGVARHAEAARDQRGTVFLEELRRDIGLAVRGMRRNPGFAVVAILTLALGIGANTAIFSMVDGVLLRPAPFDDPERLVMVWETDRNSGTSHEPASVPDYLDFERRSDTVEELGAILPTEATLGVPASDPERVTMLAVTPGTLALLGIRPVAGRAFAEGEQGDPLAVVSEALWRGRFGSDPDVVGRSVSLDGSAATIVGVLPDDADWGIRQVLGAADYGRSFADRGARRVDVWTPLDADPAAFPRTTHPVFLVGRLRPGAAIEAAQGELAAIADDIEAEHPENAGRGVHVAALTEVVVGPVRAPLLLLLAAVGMVLLIACVNVASLLLARATAREREVAIRIALGGGRARLTRQFLTEGAVYAVLAAAVGVGFAAAGLGALVGAAPGDLPALERVGLDLRVLGVTAGVAVLVTLMFGLVPAAQASARDLGGRLQGGGARTGGASPRARRARSALVVVELALAVAIATGAGLLVRSFAAVTSVDPGFRTEGVVKAELRLPAATYPRDFSVWPRWPRTHAFGEALLAELSGVPGVRGAALAGPHPLAAGSTNSFAIEGRDPSAAPLPEIPVRPVSNGYFDIMGVPLLAGRTFARDAATDGPALAVINQAAAEAFFDGDPVGGRLTFWGAQREIVGVVGNETFHGLDRAPPPAVYVPMAQVPQWNLSVLVRGADRGGLGRAVRDAIQRVDPSLAVFGVEPLTETLSGSLASRSFPTLLMTLMAFLALALAVIGVHGVLSYSVEQRRRELGIRMALGARRRDVIGLVVGEGLRLGALGLALGLFGAWAGTRLLSALLFGIQPTDPLTFALVAGVVLAAALVATIAPAVRAARVDPARILQAQ